MWAIILKYAAKVVVYAANHPDQVDEAIAIAKQLAAAKQGK